METSSDASPANQLLHFLSAEEYEQLLPHMELVELPLGKILYSSGERIKRVYFPHNAVISLVSNLKSGATAEVATVSSEGLVGLPVFLGSDVGTNDALVLIPGTAAVIDSQVFTDEFCKSRVLRSLLHRYTNLLLTQTSQTLVCNRLHHIEERLARWLLLLHDRAGKEGLNLTQETISEMLGTRRASVTTAAVKFQDKGLIKYRRGNIRIIDPQGLEAFACECYEIIKAAFDQQQIAHFTENVIANSDNLSISQRTQANEDREEALETLREINGRLLIAGIREQEARAEAEAANQAKEEFLANVSHELRTPLNAMLGWSRLLRAGKLDQTSTTRALQVIESNAEAQQQLVESLLELSRFTADPVELNGLPLDLIPVLESTLDTLRPAAEAKNLTLTSSVDSERAMVFGSARRLRQIFLNLLSNAIKFTPNAGRIDVVTKNLGTHIRITVTDTGEGITAELLPHVFDRFQRSENIARTNDGLGLGLTIVHRLVELHRGTITVESPGQGLGSTFTITLPAIDHPVG